MPAPNEIQQLIRAAYAPLKEDLFRYVDERLRAPVVPKEWFDSNEAGQYLGLHGVTLAKMRKAGRGPRWHQAEATIRYRKADLDSWLTRGDA